MLRLLLALLLVIVYVVLLSCGVSALPVTGGWKVIILACVIFGTACCLAIWSEKHP
jgi:K+ transporter